MNCLRNYFRSGVKSSRIPRWLGMLGWLGMLIGRLNAVTPPDFTREIRPILSDNCFACHGPDENQRKGKYRLDTRRGAFKSSDGEDLIIPGKALGSPLYQRLITHDDDDLMPPTKAGRKLTEKQIELVREWINAGARWDEHWAFQTPERPVEPAVKNVTWPKTPVDRFVLARLESEGIDPVPEADPTTLVRRASFDLTGLPPSVEEIDAYLADRSSNAFEKVVDRLLKSPRYGENMARYWMDAVRYADTHGYHIDSQRDIWAYRQWVIEAFNRDLPFDQFTIEQLAGDLLPSPTRDQKIATGFVRCNMSTGEGGAIVEEYRAKYAFDRVETVGTVWLGVTMLCARCHTHKYDPIPQSEYYGMFSFFNNLDEPIMDGNKANPDPYLKLPSPAQTERLEWLNHAIAEGDRKMDEPNAELDPTQPAWVAGWHEHLRGQMTLLTPVKASASRTGGLDLAIRGDGTLGAIEGGDAQVVFETAFAIAPGKLAGLRLEVLRNEESDGKTLPAPGRWALSEFEAELNPPALTNAAAGARPLKFVRAFASAGADGFGIDRAIDGKAETGWALAANGTNREAQAFFVPSEITDVPVGTELKVRLRHSVAGMRQPIPRFRVSAAQQPEIARLMFPTRTDPWQVVGPFPAEEPAAAFATTHPAEKELDLKKAYPGVRGEVKWSEQRDIEDGRSHRLIEDLHGIHGIRLLLRNLHSTEARETEMTISTEAWYKVWLNGQLVVERAREARPGEEVARARLTLKAGDNQLLVKLVSIQGATFFNFTPDRNAKESLPPGIAGILSVTPEPSADPAKDVRRFYRRQQSPEFRSLGDSLVSMREESVRIDRAIPTTLIAKEIAQPRETTLLLRGEYDKPGAKVSPGILSALSPFSANAPTNRLGLAQWLVDPRHPLTARVIVNRFWHQIFGAGLVRTTDDFGSQGDRPSHPDLLDWLATEFVRTGWNVKGLQKTILMSATYQQSSKASVSQRLKDPENRWLARGPRFRLDGEVVRDTCLMVGGLLHEKIGGPSAHPYEPPGLWEAVSFNNSQRYVQDRNDSQYRRGLYTFWKRQSPPPTMLLFDAPTRETCLVRRARTNTPLQALATLNDPQFIEAARAFAQRIVKHAGMATPERIRYAFRLATGRIPQSDEVGLLVRIFEKSLAEYRNDPAAARALLVAGDFRGDPSLDASDVAAWTTVANLLFNLDETITKN